MALTPVLSLCCHAQAGVAPTIPSGGPHFLRRISEGYFQPLCCLLTARLGLSKFSQKFGVRALLSAYYTERNCSEARRCRALPERSFDKLMMTRVRCSKEYPQQPRLASPCVFYCLNYAHSFKIQALHSKRQREVGRDTHHNRVYSESRAKSQLLSVQ